jgi:hypothetical protein
MSQDFDCVRVSGDKVENGSADGLLRAESHGRQPGTERRRVPKLPVGRPHDRLHLIDDEPQPALHLESVELRLAALRDVLRHSDDPGRDPSVVTARAIRRW